MSVVKGFVFDWVNDSPIPCEGIENFDFFYDKLKELKCEHFLPKGFRVTGEVIRLENGFVVEMEVCTFVDTKNDGENDIWVEYELTYNVRNNRWTLVLYDKTGDLIEFEKNGVYN